MITILGYGLAVGNPLVYLIIFIILFPPIFIIICYIIEEIKERNKK